MQHLAPNSLCPNGVTALLSDTGPANLLPFLVPFTPALQNNYYSLCIKIKPLQVRQIEFLPILQEGKEKERSKVLSVPALKAVHAQIQLVSMRPLSDWATNRHQVGVRTSHRTKASWLLLNTRPYYLLDHYCYLSALNRYIVLCSQ